jgi:flagellum-specific ATP synthase
MNPGSSAEMNVTLNHDLFKEDRVKEDLVKETHPPGGLLKPYFSDLAQLELLPWCGEVTATIGLLIESQGPAVAIGDFCQVFTANGRSIRTQVIGFRNGRVLSMPLEEPDGLQLGAKVIARTQETRLAVGPGLLGRVLDGFGQPMDDGPPIEAAATYPLYSAPPNPLSRVHITQRLTTGIRSIDSLLTCGQGQRIGLFGGSGVGKSTLLGAMSRRNSADVTVIALIGERNREVKAFLDHELGKEGMKRSLVVVATSDRPAPLRIRAAFVALAAAEYFRDQGLNVLLVMDSVTRLAMAQREIGLAAGEPPSQKGYTPSVFSLLPKIFERAGNFEKGSITGFFTVLVEGDDFNEPICDATRGILDGHVILSRDLAATGHYPAIDVLNSVSRLANKVATPAEVAAAQKLREAMALYHQSSDLIQLGAHVQGANLRLDQSIRTRPQILDFLRQSSDTFANADDTKNRLLALAKELS